MLEIDVAQEDRNRSLRVSPQSQRHSGQGLVELALTLPVMLFMMLALIDFALLMVADSSLSTASRDAARYAASAGETASGIFHFQDCTGIRDRARALTLFALPVIAIEYDPDGPGPCQRPNIASLRRALTLLMFPSQGR